MSTSTFNEAFRRPLPAAAAVGTLTLLGWATVALRQNYVLWKSMGPGGFPYTPFGWAAQHLINLTMGHSNTTSLATYDKAVESMNEDERAIAEWRYLDDLPQRKEPNSRALPFAIPQREKKTGGKVQMLSAQNQLFDKIVAANPTLIHSARSHLEGPVGDAMHLNADITSPSIAQKTKSELCHIHPSDGSSHVTLSFADAKEVLSKGWGERHRAAGSKFLQLGYTFLYAPRDDEEVEVMGRIFRAGIAFMTGGKEVD